MSRGDYIQVVDDVVVGYPTSLPKNWGEVSNFFVLTDEELQKYGWYPVVIEKEDVLEPNMVIERQVFSFNGKEVIQSRQIREKTEEEIEQEVNQLWDQIRSQRDVFLSSTDWTQLPDAPITEEEKAEWSVYRQEIRDVPNLFDSPYDIVWPEPPQSKHKVLKG
jgi:hypothetical protein